MVIHQFNKLIRNKWVWGVFAIVVSLAFCFDDLFSGRGSDQPVERGSAGNLWGESVGLDEFETQVDNVRGFGQQRDTSRNSGEVNLEAWQNLAMMRVAERTGTAATDADVKRAIANDESFRQDGKFSFRKYQVLLAQNGITPEKFEQYMKDRLSAMHLAQAILSGASWVSPMELEQAVADVTDTFTVKVAKFTQDREAAKKITVDDTQLKKWYDDNVKNLELPERCKIRYVKYDATDAAVLAKMVVTDEMLRDHYDVTSDKYTVTDTNGVESVKKFEEVKDAVEKEVRQIAAVQYFETNLNFRAYGVKAKEGASRLDEIAKEDNAKIETSDWFATDGGYQEGFMKRIGQICPGAKEFSSAVAELDSSSEDLRYGVVSSERAVWLIEKVEVSPKHTPAFDEAKECIRERALRDAKADAFKAEVEAVAAKGAAAVAAVKDVSTNLTFAVTDLRGGTVTIENAMTVARAAMPLKKGEVSEFTLTSPGRAILVVCEDRKPGDAAKAMVMRTQVRDELSMMMQRRLPEAWKKWNLENAALEATEATSTNVVEYAE